MRKRGSSAVNDSAWPEVQALIAASPRTVEVLPLAVADAGVALARIGVTTRSPMGAVVFESGGIVLDHGWLRLHGGGAPGLASMADASPLPASGPSPYLVVGHDILGGRFAVNGGGLMGTPGHVVYFAPDALEWETLDMGYGQFLDWTLTRDLPKFYESFRWPGWESEVSALRLDQAISFYPFLFTVEGRDVAAASRKPVPLAEILALQS